MRVLVGCEFSGIVRDAFRARGHDAWSCDLEPSEGDPRWHVVADVREVIGQGWDMMVAFPPCTDLTTTGASHWAIKQADGRQQAALGLVRDLMLAPIRHIAVENPAGRINTALRPPDQIIQPWQFGDPWTKRTCLWLLRLPPLRPSQVVLSRGHWVDGGTSAVSPDRDYRAADKWSGPERARLHSLTFPGIAAAMADQWGSVFSYQDTLL